MKKVLLMFNILIAVAVIFLLVQFFKEDKQLVYINLSKLLVEYKGMKNLNKEMEQKSKVWQANIDTLGKELENEIMKFEKSRIKNSEKENKLHEELLRNKQQQFMQYQEAIRKKRGEEDKKMKEKVLGEINSYIKEFGEEHHYNYIMGATAMGNLVYANPSLEITDKVLGGLNKRYTGK